MTNEYDRELIRAHVQYIAACEEVEKTKSVCSAIAGIILGDDFYDGVVCDGNFSDGKHKVVFRGIEVSGDKIEIVVSHFYSDGRVKEWDSRYDFACRSIFVPTKESVDSKDPVYSEAYVSNLHLRNKERVSQLAARCASLMPPHFQKITLAEIEAELARICTKKGLDTRAVGALKSAKLQNAAQILAWGIENINGVGKQAAKLISMAIQNLTGEKSK